MEQPSLMCHRRHTASGACSPPIATHRSRSSRPVPPLLVYPTSSSGRSTPWYSPLFSTQNIPCKRIFLWPKTRTLRPVFTEYFRVTTTATPPPAHRRRRRTTATATASATASATATRLPRYLQYRTTIIVALPPPHHLRVTAIISNNTAATNTATAIANATVRLRTAQPQKPRG